VNIPQVVEGTFTGNGNSAFVRADGDLLLILTGPFSATIKLGTANPPADRSSTPSFTTLNQDEEGNDILFTAPVSTRLRVGAKGMLWRLECSGFVSGPVGYKLVSG
jgi:hypothetical protein